MIIFTFSSKDKSNIKMKIKKRHLICSHSVKLKYDFEQWIYFLLFYIVFHDRVFIVFAPIKQKKVLKLCISSSLFIWVYERITECILITIFFFLFLSSVSSVLFCLSRVLCHLQLFRVMQIAVLPSMWKFFIIFIIKMSSSPWMQEK